MSSNAPPPQDDAPVEKITKAPCLCGCAASIKSWWASGARATPQFTKQVDDGVKALLVQTKRVQTSGRQSTTLDIPPLTREFLPAPVVSPADQLDRLKTLVQILQQPTFFVLASGSFPTAIQWTSTVLATFVIDYSTLTNDNQYFNNFTAFFKNQPVASLTFQGYDDKLWVVLTYLRAASFAQTHDTNMSQPFLDRAKYFYNLCKSGWDTKTCGGGMFWQPMSSYKNAVTTELWITASMGMYEAFKDDEMLHAAVRGWTWFKTSGMINAQGTVNDGLGKNCKNNGQTTWTYNQAIVLSGLSKLYKYTEDPDLIKSAQNLIDSVLSSPLVPDNTSILVETCDPARTCSQDQWMFKGIYFEHLGYFLEDLVGLDELSLETKTALLQKYNNLIQANAAAVWDVARGPDGKVGNWWAGPPGNQVQRQVSVETHGSGIAAIACAVRINKLMQSLEAGNVGINAPPPVAGIEVEHPQSS